MDKFKLKLTMIFGILAVGIIGAFFIINGISSNGVDLAGQQQNSGDSLSQLQNDNAGIFIENGDSAGGSVNPGNSTGNPTYQNLTETFGNSFLNQVQAADVAHQTPDNLKKSAGSMSKGILADVLSASPQLKTVSDINDSALKISYDNSVLAKKQYLKIIGGIAVADFSDAGKQNILQVINSVYSKNNPAVAATLAKDYKKAVADFSSVSVPSDWVAFHKEVIVYYQNSGIVYDAMSNYSTDPVKGYVALEMADAITADGDQLRKNLNDKINEVNK